MAHRSTLRLSSTQVIRVEQSTLKSTQGSANLLKALVAFPFGFPRLSVNRFCIPSTALLETEPLKPFAMRLISVIARVPSGRKMQSTRTVLDLRQEQGSLNASAQKIHSSP